MQKIIFFLGIATLVFNPHLTFSGTLGDINADGDVGLQEAIYALQIVTGIKPQMTTIDVARYANLKINNRWEYSEFGGGAVAHEVIDIISKNGKNVYLVQESWGTSLSDRFYYQTDMAQGLIEIGGINNYQKPDEFEFFWEPALPALMPTFVPGQEYTGSQTQTPTNDVVNLTIIIEPEIVTVPAGTFSDCFKVTFSGEFNEQTFTYFKWFAKDVGMVKRIGFGGGTWELTAYTSY